MPLGFIGDVLGLGGDDVEQTTTVDIVNENLFSPVIDITLSGLDAIGNALREGLSLVSGQGQSQTQSIDQGALNIASAIDGAGQNISFGIVDASENVENGISRAGVNIAAAVVLGATVLAVSGLGRRRAKS